MKIEDDAVTLSTGRQLYANRGIIGIGPDLETYEGYDGDFEPWSKGPQALTAAERNEIANFMINLWNLWAEVR